MSSKAMIKKNTTRGKINKEPKMTEKEIQENRKILRDMERKLNFLRNPRFRSNKNCLLYENKDFKEVVSKDNPFAVSPPIIIFRDYIIGKLYEISINLTNKTQLLTCFKHIPPASEYFAIKDISFPKKDSSLIAPGMNAKISILFKPNSLDNYEDFLTIITEQYAFKIPIRAIRDAPALSIETPMNCGNCLVGAQTTMNFLCRNNGGDAHFIFEIPQKDMINSNYHELENDEHENALEEENLRNVNYNEETLQFGQFYIFPKQFFLHKGKSIELLVNFNPTTEGLICRDLNIIIDSKAVIPHQVQGVGVTVELKIIELNGLPIDINNEITLDKILFDDTFPNQINEKTIKIKNFSHIDAKYHWTFYDYYEATNIKLTNEKQYFKITPNEGVIEAGCDVLFKIVFNPKHSKIYEKSLDFILEDVPFQAIKKLNKVYSPENNSLMVNQGNALNIQNYNDPFMLGHLSPFPFYPLFTITLKGLCIPLKLNIINKNINFGNIYLGSPIQESIFSIINPLEEGKLKFKLKRIYQLKKKNKLYNNYFNNFKIKPKAKILFNDYYNEDNYTDTVYIKNEVEKEDNNFLIGNTLSNVSTVILRFNYLNRHGERIIKEVSFPNLLDLIIKLADDRLYDESSDYETCNLFEINSDGRFYNVKVDFYSVKKMKLNEGYVDLKKNIMTENDYQSDVDLKESNHVQISNLKNNQEETSFTGITINSNLKMSTLRKNPNVKIREHMIFEMDTNEKINFKVNFNPIELGVFKSSIIIIAQDSEPVYIDIIANVINPDIRVNTSAIIFPLCEISKVQKETIVIESISNTLNTEVLIKESRYKDISFDNYNNYNYVGALSIDELEKKERINNIEDFENKDLWKENPQSVDSYKIKFSEIYLCLKPKEKREVTLYFTSKYPTLLNELIEIQVKNSKSKFIRLEANTQVADCYIDYPYILPDDIFISLPISYNNNSFNMINPSNLPINFKWNNINDKENAGIIAKFHPSKGEIKPMSSMIIKYDIIFYNIINVDQLFICDISEIELPLGVNIKGLVKGLDVSYETVDNDKKEEFGRTTRKNSILNRSKDSISGTKTKGVTYIKDFDFKLKVNGFSTQSFIISNNSGIATKFNFSIKNYKAFDNQLKSPNRRNDSINNNSTSTGLEHGMLSNDTSRSSISTYKNNKLAKINNKVGQLTKQVLSDKHESYNFTSEKGKEFSLIKQIEREAETYLKNKKGVAVVVFPLSGSLKPFSKVKITINVYNDCVGDFTDELDCDIKSLGKQTFPINIQVRGNPIQLSPYQPGITYKSQVPIINIGSVLTKAGYIEKTFKLINTGNNVISLNWKMYDYDDIQSPNRDIVSIDIANENNKFKFKFSPLEPNKLINRYYKIEPEENIIEPKSTKEYKITFITDKEGLKSALLLANMKFEEEINLAKMSDLAIRIDGIGVKPHLTVDKEPNFNNMIVYKFIQCSSSLNKLDLRLLNKCTFVNQLSVQDGNKKSIILMNKLKIEMNIKIQIDGPFTLTDSFPKESIKILSKKENDSNVYSIMPDSNLKLNIKYISPLVNDYKEWPMLMLTEKHGSLRILYENGDLQDYYLKAILKRPRILISTTGNTALETDDIINFGYVSVESYSEASIYIMNETEVSTSWELNYVKFIRKVTYGYATTTNEEKEDQVMIDNPNVFVFNKTSGLIHGPSNILTNMPIGPGLPKRDDYKIDELKPVLVKIIFKPIEKGLYKSRFKITTPTGNTVELTLKGYGSFNEEHIKPILKKN